MDNKRVNCSPAFLKSLITCAFSFPLYSVFMSKQGGVMNITKILCIAVTQSST